MHCSATADRYTGRSSVLFGLSGTGKTTLSADAKRLLIGDDEHCWTDQGVFNIERGCYAKTYDLSSESEPDIFQALHFGALLENVVLDEVERRVDFRDASITQNTRGAYPIEFIQNAKVPCMGGHPTNIIFLSCDAFGVLPPVAKLTRDQALYYFLSGYTAKVAGTEVGVNKPQATFSACFGAPFLVWSPLKYAELLGQKLDRHGANVWLVNTGWTGGAYGVGSRIKLKYTRAIIDAIHRGQLETARTEWDNTFGLAEVVECPDLPTEVLSPRRAWKNEGDYHQAAARLAELFIRNFQKFTDKIPASVAVSGPRKLQLVE